MNFDNLPTPTAIEELDFELILKDIIALFKDKVPDYTFLESDNYAPIFEALAYRELLLRARVNYAYRQMLLPTANGGNLDNVVALYGIERLKGEYPKAQVEFTLSEAKPYKVTIYKGFKLSSNNNEIAVLTEKLEIMPYQIKGVGIVELQMQVQVIDVKTEIMQNPLPYISKVKQLTGYNGGSLPESDKALRVRAVKSLKTNTTAGSRGSYEFYTLSADARIDSCFITSNRPGVVSIYLKSDEEVEEIKQNVLATLNDEKIRPLTDSIEVCFATKKVIDIDATLYLNNINHQNNTYNELVNNKPSLKIGENFYISQIYSYLQLAGVNRVLLSSPSSDIIAEGFEYIVIANLHISFEEV